MNKSVDVLIFTDIGTTLHMKTIGPYQIATQLRKHGYYFKRLMSL